MFPSRGGRSSEAGDSRRWWMMLADAWALTTRSPHRGSAEGGLPRPLLGEHRADRERAFVHWAQAERHGPCPTA